MYLRFYVYAYLRKSDLTPYYIGKGTGNRAWSRNHSVSVPRDPTKIIILEHNLSEIGALAIERRMIRWYGRKDLETGILYNRTEGGDGVSGRVSTVEQRLARSQLWQLNGHPRGFNNRTHSLESKEKIAESRRGKTLSDDSKAKISKANAGRKHTDQSKRKISAAQTGPNNNNFGKPRSEETRRKIAEGVKRRYAERISNEKNPDA